MADDVAMTGAAMTGLAGALRALLAGDVPGALGVCRARVAAAPGDIEARYLLASALAAAGDGLAASQALEEARMLHALTLARGMGADLARLSTDEAYAVNVATQLYNAHHVAAASVVFGRAVAAGHKSLNGLLSYGLSLQHQSRAAEAIRVFRAALELYPSAGVHQFMLYPHFMLGPEAYAAEAKVWAARWAPPGEAPRFANPPAAGRKLKIGYVSPTFAGSQVRQFIAPILERHDPEAVEITLFPAKTETETGWPAHIAVEPIGHLNDPEACAAIRRKGIDILVDCWGHSAGSRLAVFALRAAPVQAAWINFVQTTGLRQMDYVLHADSMDAPGTAALFAEEVWSMGEIIVPYQPPPERPEPTPSPALASGRITFGSFNHPAKLSDATVRAWSRILQGRPGSRLVLKYRYFVDPVLQSATRARFAAERVAPERIEFRGQSEGAGYLAAFAEIDLALDPSPCPGGTTTCDALAVGVPVLTLAGDDFYARIGIMCLEGAGLPELVATSWADYVAKAVALTADPVALGRLRARVRPGLDGGPHRDEAGFTRRLEATFREMYERWRAPDASRGAA